MYERWLPFVNAKLHDDEAPSIISQREVISVMKNRCKSRVGIGDKTREKPVDWYGYRISQNENSASSELPSVCDSKSKNQRRHCGRNNGWNNYSLWIFFLQNFLMVSVACNSADLDKCAIGINTPGRTWPKGDIILEHGQPLRIYCTLNENLTDPEFRGRNASDLLFSRNDMLVEPEYMTVINETTIMLNVDQPSPSENMYLCKLKCNVGQSSPEYAAICLNKVHIGFKPKEPLSFGCVSHNWENLTCTWEPALNYVKTRYSLSFKLPGRAGSRLAYSCPVSQMSQNLPPNTCVWDVSTDPTYRLVFEHYTFILSAENILGKKSFIYKFHHWAHVIPSQPVNLSIINKTSSSALLYWRVPFRMASFPPGLYHRVSYRSKQDPQSVWQTIDIRDHDFHATEKYFNITGLQYANAIYEVRVFLKSAKATDEDSWSQSSNITFKTSATLPGLPPRTDIGSFETVGNSDSRDVYIYWQAIPTHLENGDYFRYQVVRVEENGHRLNLYPYEMTESYAMFKGISLNKLAFDIVAVNIKGANEHKSTIHVPSQLEIPPKPVVFTKIAFGGGIYELSWNLSRNFDVVDYTIFWCENDQDRPYQCSGYLDWVHVPQDTRIYNTTVRDPKKLYQFAIAANTAQASSGMAWASSITSRSDVVGKMKSVWITRIESDLIEVEWELEYSGRIGIIKGFNIYYCPIVSVYNLTCDGPKMITTVGTDPYMLHGLVRNLKPQTTYLITVALVTENGEGLHSDALYITTLKTAVDPVSKNPTLTDIPSKPASVPFDVNLSTEIGQSSIVNTYGGETKQRYNEAVDYKVDRIVPLNSDSIDCITQMSNWIHIVSAYEKKLNSLSDENRLLRKNLLRCNEIW